MPKRRDHGQGGLFYIQSRQLWRGVVDDGFNDDGTRRQRYVHSKSRDECIKKLRTLTHQLAEDGRPLDHRTRVADLADRWMEDSSRRLKPKTMQGYRSNVSSNVLPTLGSRLVAELRPSDIRRLHSAIFARGVGPATVAGAHRTVSAMLSYAVEEGLVSRNVAELVDLPKQAPTSRDSLSREEAKALMSLGDPRWMLPLQSGARDGEMRALRWRDIDLDNRIAQISWNLIEVTSLHGCGGTCGRKSAGRCPERIVDIAPSLEHQLLEGRWALVRPKSYKPRSVPLSALVAEALRGHQVADHGANPHGLVWHRDDGRPLTNSDSNAEFRRALERAHIARPATTHWLRHTYTTMAEHAGIPWVVYAGISGHGSEDISRKYTHQLKDQARDGIDTLTSYLSPP